MGAWIAILGSLLVKNQGHVAPSWGRGLQSRGDERVFPGGQSGRPLMGAWIAMDMRDLSVRIEYVAPSWGRGLQYITRALPKGGALVAPSWGRGLQYIIMLVRERIQVAPSWGRGLQYSYTCIRRLPEHNEYFQPVRKKSSLTGCFVMPIFKLLKFLQLFSFWGLTLFAGFPASPNPVFRSKAAFSVYSSSKIPFY